MNAPRGASLWKWIARNRMALASAAIVLAYAVFIDWLFGWRAILAQWQATGFLVVAGAVAMLVATHLMRAWRIRDYFAEETRGRFARLFRLAQMHNMLNVLLPMRSGELSFPMLMRAEFGVSVARAGSALMVMRLLDLHALLAAGAIGLVLRMDQSALGWSLWCLFLALPAAGYAARTSAFKSARAIAPVRWRPILDEMEAGLPRDGRLFARAWAITLANWFAKILTLAAMLALMGVEPPAAALGGALGGELSSVLPVHAPAGVGTYPAAMTAGALALGASPDMLAATSRASINVHLLVVVSALVSASVAMAAMRFAEPRR